MKKSLTSFASASVIAAVTFSGAANADDIYAPLVAGLDNIAVAFWEEETEGAGDLFLFQFDPFESLFPLTDFDGGEGPGQPALDINAVADGEEWDFFMPNFVDILPLKLMRIQVTFSGPEPSIVDTRACTGCTGFRCLYCARLRRIATARNVFQNPLTRENKSLTWPVVRPSELFRQRYGSAFAMQGSGVRLSSAPHQNTRCQ
jgi:hypothetical protein